MRLLIALTILSWWGGGTPSWTSLQCEYTNNNGLYLYIWIKSDICVKGNTIYTQSASKLLWILKMCFCVSDLRHNIEIFSLQRCILEINCFVPIHVLIPTRLSGKHVSKWPKCVTNCYFSRRRHSTRFNIHDYWFWTWGENLIDGFALTLTLKMSFGTCWKHLKLWSWPKTAVGKDTERYGYIILIMIMTNMQSKKKTNKQTNKKKKPNITNTQRIFF